MSISRETILKAQERFKLYLAAVYTSNFGKSSTLYAKLTESEKAHRDRHPYILESYHYIHKESFVDKIRNDGIRVFLDSGAFSAFTKGVEIDIPGYCDYVKKNKDIIEEVEVEWKGYRGKVQLFSVLDCIGDKGKGLGTLENQRKMEKLGVYPLPCFHYGEDVEYLKYYIDRYPYITLGGMVPIPTGNLASNDGGKTGLYAWLDHVWDNYLTDSAGHPKVKVHGFGLTTVELMTRYPWYSVDSSSWVQIAVHGNILIPDNKVMSAALNSTDKVTPGDKIVAISSDSPRRKDQDYHYDTVSPVMQAAIKRYIELQDFDVDRLKTSAYSRWAWNFFSFHEINRRVDDKINITFKPEQRGLF